MLPLPPSRRPDRPLFPSYFRNCSKAAFACFRPRLGTGGEAVNEPLALRCRTAPDKLVGKRAGTAILRAFPQVPANRRHNRVSERNLCRCAPAVRPPACRAFARRISHCLLRATSARVGRHLDTTWTPLGPRGRRAKGHVATARLPVDWHDRQSHLATWRAPARSQVSPARSAGPLDRGVRGAQSPARWARTPSRKKALSQADLPAEVA